MLQTKLFLTTLKKWKNEKYSQIVCISRIYYYRLKTETDPSSARVFFDDDISMNTNIDNTDPEFGHSASNKEIELDTCNSYHSCGIDLVTNSTKVNTLK